MKNSEIAEKTRKILEEHGWGKRRYYEPDTDKYCLTGAAYRALTGRPVDSGLSDSGTAWDEIQSLRHCASILAPGVPPSIAYEIKFSSTKSRVEFYNDKVALDIGDILDVCDRAAKYWRDKGE